MAALLVALPAGTVQARYQIADIVDQVSPGVVSVHMAGADTDDPTVIPREGMGSGFIVSEDGLILTNHHVIQDAPRITVGMPDGTTFEDVEVIGHDRLSDLAILQISAADGQTFHPVGLGNSDQARVGETVLAFGNPFGFQLGEDLTVTKGIISTKNRTIETEQAVFQDFLQTDAAINPGNSGGPLVTIDGKAVGINTAIIPYAQGIGFAIPINRAKDIMDQLLEEGKIARPWLGAMVQPREGRGVAVETVAPDSDAARAGLRSGDVILEVNRQPVDSREDMFRVVEDLEIGEQVYMVVRRNGARHYLVTEIEERP